MYAVIVENDFSQWAGHRLISVTVFNSGRNMVHLKRNLNEKIITDFNTVKWLFKPGD